MRIATWNLDLGVNRRSCPEHLLNEIKNVDSTIGSIDVWILTETYPARSPLKGFRLVAESKAATSEEPATDKSWTAIWIREGIPAEEKPTECDVTRTACAKLPNTRVGPMYVYGTVLPWPPQGEDAFIGALEQQEADWQRIRSGDPQAAFCLAGDLNQYLLEKPYYRQSHRAWCALQSALHRSGLTCLTAGVNDPLHKPGTTLASIDHICVSDALLPKDNGVIAREVSLLPDSSRNCCYRSDKKYLYNGEGKRLSDHYGVAATLNA